MKTDKDAPADKTGRPKIAVIHPRLQVGGGSEACVLRIMEALKGQYQLTLVTSKAVNFSDFNSFYHTDINPEELSIILVSPPWLLKSGIRFAALRGFRLNRFCKEKSAQFDLMFSAYNQMDFGREGIQYILDPFFNQQMLSMLNPSPQKWKRWFYRDSLLRKAYLRLGENLSRFTFEGMKQNLTLVDSDWTGRLTQAALGLKTQTLYPPVPDEFPESAWNQRENGFLCMGRIVPEKQIERVIKILKEVRNYQPELHLHIIGRRSDGGYARELERFCAGYRDWIFFENDVPARKKLDFLSAHKYGIHGKENEPFGITIAEMVKAGCIVWVPNGGGQVEIVRHPWLIYEDIEDAVEKIRSILKSEALQDRLRRHLSRQARIFSVEQFMQTVRNIVLQFFKGHDKIQK